MFLDLKLEQKHEMFCEEAIMASVAVWFKRRYEMIFSQSWNFKIREEDPEYPGYFGSRILLTSGDQLQLLERYHGIRTIYHDVSDFAGILNIANEQITAGFPIVVWINYDYVPLIPEKIRLSESFPFLIAGVDDVHQNVYCLDVHYVKKIFPLSFENFAKAFSGCVTFELAHDEMSNIDWRQIIKFNTEALRENDSFNLMKEFSRQVPYLDQPRGINGRSDIREVIEKLKLIYRSRIVFSDALAYLIENHQAQALLERQKRLKELANQWYLAWGCLSKANLQRNLNFKLDFASSLENVAKKIFNLAVMEEELCVEMEHVLQGKSVAVKETPLFTPAPIPLPLKERYHFQYLDISGYFNNEGFADDFLANDTASLSTGQFFLTGGLPDGDIWESGGIQFYFSRPADGVKDNIVCKGQTIEFSADYYRAVFVLGCAEWGHQSETVTVHYHDGSAANLPFEISDWSCQIPNFGELVVWEGKCALRDGNEVSEIPWFKGHLFAQAIPLGGKLQASKLGLPENPNIHIFAITLGK